MLYKPSRNQLHERIRILSPEYDPVHVESYLRLRHGPGSENYMTDRQFAEAVRLATDRQPTGLTRSGKTRRRDSRGLAE